MKDLFDIGDRSQPGERQTDIELIIEEKAMNLTDAELKRLKALLAGWEKYSPSPRKGVAMAKIERKIKELEGK